MRLFSSAVLLSIVFTLVPLLPPPALADGALPLSVSVGYADNSHCATFNTSGPGSCVSPLPSLFPNPWSGSPNTNFIGTGVAGVAFDSGALLLTNNSGSAVTVDDVKVTVGSSSFDLWGSFTIANGFSTILTQFNFTGTNVNFDTSDTSGPSGGSCCSNDGLIPQITITVGGITTTLNDTGQILNTGGFDLGCQTADCVSTNESHPWSLIFSPSTPAPEPTSLGLLSSGLLGLALIGVLQRRFAS